MVNIIKEPAVYLVTRTVINDSEMDGFLDEIGQLVYWGHEEDADTIPEMAGRICYMSYNKGRKTNDEYLRHILEVKHGSVLEHNVFGFILTGVSRSFTHELVRHRHLSFSQLSQRYVDESDVGFILPPEIDAQDGLRDSWIRSCYTSLTAYKMLLAGLELGKEKTTQEKKIARQTARSVLPNCTETKIFVTGNTRAWRHFLELRTNQAAESEIRRVAVKILKKLQGAAPNSFNDFKIGDPDTQGIPVVTVKYPGV